LTILGVTQATKSIKATKDIGIRLLLFIPAALVGSKTTLPALGKPRSYFPAW